MSEEILYTQKELDMRLAIECKHNELKEAILMTNNQVNNLIAGIENLKDTLPCKVHHDRIEEVNGYVVDVEEDLEKTKKTVDRLVINDVKKDTALKILASAPVILGTIYAIFKFFANNVIY